ncbi:amidohydrolase family protein [Mesorhizobium sp. VK23B]|uniref:Amidohydrolase family protein n=1 Tax=Mesorhizobium dulcispinae TaxID=3072316 RepID=A0ABU4XMT8_9HYPH|nr:MULTISPECIES: amidohydrolase family protein [unclassified Mesorhizobium]MDX8469729.1 amidohydrolase family protein [Mesorhizobium sp. VK23B]MDX8476068.1 amidohydrolase family protein [Mesorhizobium sp. VK23A]
MSSYLFKNARIVDGSAAEPTEPIQVLVEDSHIREVGRTISASAAEVIDLTGKTLMPGLIDCHVHTIASIASFQRNAGLPDSLVAARASIVMRNMLMRGFTTVRDAGGADFGIKCAVEEGVFSGPRLVISGKALSQTGGHCDFRGRHNSRPEPRTGFALGALGRVCDGVPDLRLAAREEIKGGADFIKIMANGGAASPTDPIHFLGFSREELLAVVEEAKNAGTYVAAHLYTDEAIRRAAETGIHSLEHCNLIEPATAKFAASQSAIAVPTLVTFEKLLAEGASSGYGADALAKVEIVQSAGMESLSIMREAGLPMAYGSDLLGPMHRHQSEEFLIRARVLPAHEIIASATSVGARLCQMEGKIGTIAPNAFADLIVVDGNPLDDLSLLANQGGHMPLIMQGGKIVKRTELH